MKLKLIITIALIIFSGCSQVNNKFIVGEWIAIERHNDKVDKYIFNIDEGIFGDLNGSIQTYINDTELPSTDISEIRYSYPEFTLIMHSAGMKIQFSGKISENKMIGKFIYSNPQIEPKSLIFTRL